MTLRYIHHTGLVVSDLDRSIWFYHDLLGLPFANEPTPGSTDRTFPRRRRPGRPAAAGVAVGRRQATLELIEYAQPAGIEHRPRAHHLGAAHVCFRVDDVRAKRAELEAQGVTFYSDVNVVDEGPLAGWRWCYFSDPDGLALELVEIAYYLEEERTAAAEQYLRSRPSLAEIASAPA